MNVKIYINNEQLSLFKDESISVTSSVLDIEDITKNTTDYSKEFTVPANETNNYIFKHYYNANVDNLFDARVTHSGHIELDGFIFRVGKWILRRVNVSKGVAKSYSINFWGNLTSLKDEVGDDLLSSLNLSTYNHGYNSNNVRAGLETSLFNGVIKYSLLAKKQYYYNSDSGDTTQTDELTNIAYNGSSGENGVRWNDLKPSIRLVELMGAIEDKYGFVFSKQFLSSAAFSGLYLWLNNDATREISGGETRINWDSGSDEYINFFSNIGEYPIEGGGLSNRRWYKTEMRITPNAGYENVIYTTRMYIDKKDDAGFVVRSERVDTKGTSTLEGSIRELDRGSQVFDVYWVIETTQEFKFTSRVVQDRRDGWSKLSTETTYGSEQIISSDFDFEKNVPEIKIIDFLKGIFQAYKLVVIPQQDGTLYINTLTGYYKEGNLVNITDYVETDSETVERGNILNNIEYKFQDPETLLNTQFKANTGIAYGDESLELKSEDGELLSGGSVEIELPFEQVVYERLIDQSNGEDTDIQYGGIFDESISGVNPKPHIHYIVNLSAARTPISVISDKGVKETFNRSINTASHSDIFENPLNVFLFSQEFSTWNKEIMTSTLYSQYHAPYITDIFNPKRRNFTKKARLPLIMLLELTLNDVIQVHDDFYRLDKFTINSVTGETELNLVNSINIEIQTFSANPTDITLDYNNPPFGAAIFNMTTYTVIKTDLGFGIDWCDVSDDGEGIVYFTATKNIGTVRVMTITLIKDITLEEIEFSILQQFNQEAITVDSTLITVDSTYITI